MCVLECLQEVQLVLDHCSGAMVNEVEGLGVEVFETDQSVCKVSAATPGSERWEKTCLFMCPLSFFLLFLSLLANHGLALQIILVFTPF